MKKNEPRLVWVILVALSVLTAAALTSALATAQEEAADEPATAPEVEEPTTAPAAEEAAIPEPLGQALFNAECARCHGEDGLAQTPQGQSMGLSAFAATLDEAHAREVIVGGCGAMVGYTDLTEEQLSALLDYTMSLAQQ